MLEAEKAEADAQNELDGLLALDAELKAAYTANEGAKAALAKAEDAKESADKAVADANTPIAGLEAADAQAKAWVAEVGAIDVEKMIADAQAAADQPMLLAANVYADPAEQAKQKAELESLCNAAAGARIALAEAEEALKAADEQYAKDSAPYMAALAAYEQAKADYEAAQKAYEDKLAEEQEAARIAELAKQASATAPQAPASDEQAVAQGEKVKSTTKTGDSTQAAGTLATLFAGTALGAALAARKKLRNAKHIA